MPTPSAALRSHIATAGPAVALAAALTLLSFTTAGGVALGTDTWAEIILVVVGIAIAAAVVLRGAGGPRYGLTPFALFAALTALTAGSIAWSYAPDVTWLEAGRIAAYLAAFGGAAGLARLAPNRWSTLLAGIALAATALSAWAVLVKVFSWPIDGQPGVGRLLAPYGYWNATGLTAAVGLPPLLWAASRKSPAPITRALAVPAIALLITVVMLSFSRSALIAAIIGLAVPLAFGHSRLRAALMLGVSAVGAACVSLWALGNASITGDQISHAERVSSGHALGLVLAVVLILLVPAGLIAAYASDRTQLSEQQRRRVGTALIAALALVPLAGIGALAASSRGLTGEVSHIADSLTSTKGSVGDNPGRLLDVANTRPRYWREGLTVGEHHLLAGVGVGAFGVAHTRYQDAKLSYGSVGHAHSYVIETFADLGLIGLALNAGLLLAWAMASATTLGRRWGPSQAPAGETPTAIERDGTWALIGATLAFGVSSAIDWTWFYPGVAIPALICAGWIAGRGPLSGAIGARAQLRSGPGSILAVTGLVALAVAACWAIWQPLRSSEDVNAGITAMSAGHAGEALADAASAHSEDPVSLAPLQLTAVIDTALHEPGRARAALERAVDLQRQNPAPWLALGEFLLPDHPAAALHALRNAARLDVTNTQIQTDINTATQGLHRHHR